MKIHSHYYQIKIENPEKRSEIIEQFVILVPYKGNEKAEDAVKAVMKNANHYRNSRNQIMLERTDFTMQYLETKSSDDLQAIAIEKQGYAIIPLEGES